MSGFLRDLASIMWRHAGERYLKGYDQELTLTESRLQALEAQMSDVETLSGLYERLNEATNDIAARLKSLTDQVSSGNVAAADVVAHLQPLITRLEDMGSNETVDPTSGLDPSVITDPTNSPAADSPLINPAEDAPTDEPTPDPTINPVDIPPESQPDSNSERPNDF